MKHRHFVFMALGACSVVIAAGCSTTVHNMVEGMSDAERQVFLDNQNNTTLCSGYTNPALQPRTEAALVQELNSRGISECEDHGVKRAVPPAGQAYAAVPTAVSTESEVGKDTKKSASGDRGFCTSVFNQKHHVTTVEQYYKELADLPQRKGEYETTADFEKRRAAAFHGTPSEAMVLVDLDPEFMEYDADRQILTIKRFAFSNQSIDHYYLLKDVDVGGTGFGDYADYTEKSIDTPTGTYIGTNAFGASVEVVKMDRLFYGIFDREVTYGSNLWHASQGIQRVGLSDTENIAFQFRATPEQARSYKQTAKAVFFIRLRTPSTLTGSKFEKATINLPFERHNEYRFLHADIECAAVIDGDGLPRHPRATM